MARPYSSDPDVHAMMLALFAVTSMDPAIRSQRSEVRRSARELLKAGYTPEDVRKLPKLFERLDWFRRRRPPISLRMVHSYIHLTRAPLLVQTMQQTRPPRTPASTQPRKPQDKRPEPPLYRARQHKDEDVLSPEELRKAVREIKARLVRPSDLAQDATDGTRECS